MVFDVGSAINSTADKLISLPLINRIANNPIYTALLITFITVLIVMFVFRDVESEDSLLSLCLRSGFYMFLFVFGAVLIHNRVLIKELTATTTSAEIDGVFKGSYSGLPTETSVSTHSLEDSIIPVNVDVPPPLLMS